MPAEIQNEASTFCLGLIYSVLQDPGLRAERQGFTVGFVAAHPGAGCTHLAGLVADSLNSSDPDTALVLQCRDLVWLSSNSREENRAPSTLTASGVPPRVSSLAGSWKGSYDFRTNYMRQVREQYPYVLVDCPSLKESTDVLSLARVVDGFFIVVEANKTQKTQLAYVEQTLERAGGKILGTILNKRSYPIPEWFHNQLERWGQ